MKYWKWLICVFVTIIAIKISNCQTLSDVKRLYSDLFSNYTKQIFPMEDHTKPITIGVSFYLCSINYVKEVDEMVSFLGVFGLNWTDPSLSWDPAQYGNLNMTIIDPKEMWSPSLFLLDRADRMESVGHDITFRTTISYNGQVHISVGDILEVKCPLDISQFPYDTQECELKIFDWGSSIPFLVFQPVHKQALLPWYTVNSDWSLEDSSTRVQIENDTSMYYVNLKFKRQPMYYTITIIVPTILFAMLNPLVFVLPIESGERVSLAMTILLSYAIFLTLVSASIPASSNPMCILLVVMVVIICVSGVISGGTIISAKYYFMEDSNDFFSPLLRLTRWRLQRQNKKSVFPVEDVALEDKKEFKITGKDVSISIDNIFFYGSYIAISVIAIIFFVVIFVK